MKSGRLPTPLVTPIQRNRFDSRNKDLDRFLQPGHLSDVEVAGGVAGTSAQKVRGDGTYQHNWDKDKISHVGPNQEIEHSC